jgi:hypothetical protein
MICLSVCQTNLLMILRVHTIAKTNTNSISVNAMMKEEKNYIVLYLPLIELLNYNLYIIMYIIMYIILPQTNDSYS